ncbi:MAG: C4-type zinc ribbon domain-containing protein [candidate division KSB1 bacterium]|nr:C4-type zinc ribbon domain-containing protein [candidate division KSB1 bacterium]
MRDQLQLLVELQRLDDRLRALAQEERALPQRLQAYQAACTAAQQALEQQRAAIEQSERQQRTCERELASQQEALKKTQSKAREVKTNKEYSAVLTEIELGQQRLAALEDQLLALMEATDQQRQAARLEEQRVQAAMRELVEQEHQVQQAQADLRREMAAEQARRQEMVAALDVKLYAQYQKVAAQHGGRGVAQLQDGVCSGCYLKVQPQLISEIRLQTQLFTCPHCRRLLLWPIATANTD